MHQFIPQTQVWDHNAYNECTQARRTGGEQKNNAQNYGTRVVGETQRQTDNGMACRQHTKTETQQQELWQVALIPLLGEITPEFILFLHRMPLFIHLR